VTDLRREVRGWVAEAMDAAGARHVALWLRAPDARTAQVHSRAAEILGELAQDYRCPPEAP
jgi:hypothetical protein